MRPDETLSKLVNQSGFPLQLAIQHLVEQHEPDTGWRVLYREHGWTSPGGSTGFADLVLEDKYDSSVLVLECKRVLESDWIFTIDRMLYKSTDKTRAWVTNTPDHGREHFGYFDARVQPACQEAMFCIVAGQDTKSRPLLERISAETLSAMEAIATEECDMLFSRRNGFRFYSAVIVTTARLITTLIDPANILLATGEASEMHHQIVPWIRFRKQFSSDYAIAPGDDESDLRQLARAKEKTVFVVNAEHMAEFLKQWSIDNSSLRSLMK